MSCRSGDKHDSGFFLSELSLAFVVPMLKVLEFLRMRMIRFTRDYIKRFPGRWTFLLTLLGRKLIIWWRSWSGTFGRPESAKSPSLETQASPYSVWGGSAFVEEYVIAASYVPASASHPSLHEHTEEQPETAAQVVGTHPPVLANISVDYQHGHSPSHPFGGRSFVNRSSGNLSTLSIQSCASDRFSIITNSRESLRAPHGQPSRLARTSRRGSVNSSGSSSIINIRSRISDRCSVPTSSRESIPSTLGQPSPSQLPRVTHCQLGSGPERSWSREEATHPPTPTTRPNTPTSPRIEIIPTDLPSSLHGDGKVNTVVQSRASSSYTHEPLSPPSMSEIRRRQSSTSVVVDVQYPSTDPLPISASSNPPQISDEPFGVGSPTVHSSPDTPTVDLPDEPGSPTSFSPQTVEYFIPDGRFVQLINSDQIPRYDKNATMQVGYTILSFHPNTALQTPRGDSIRGETFDNRLPLVSCTSKYHSI